MGDKSPVQRITFQDPPSKVSPESKRRKKEAQKAKGLIATSRTTPTPPQTPQVRQRRKQTPAQRAASLRNLAKARAVRGT